MTILTLAQYRATRRDVTPTEAADLLGFDADFFEDCPAVRLYADNHFIEATNDPNKDHLLIETSEWEGPTDQMEATLYFEWYAHHAETVSDMATLLAEYAAHHKLRHASADEMLVEAPEANRNWLRWFLHRWDDVAHRN